MAVTLWAWLQPARRTVSDEWLAEQEAREIAQSAQWDGPRWSRPFNRAKDYDGLRTRAVERLRRWRA